MFHLKFKAMNTTIDKNKKNKQEINKLSNKIQWKIEELMNQNIEVSEEYKTAIIDDNGSVTGYTIKIEIKAEIFTDNTPF